MLTAYQLPPVTHPELQAKKIWLIEDQPDLAMEMIATLNQLGHQVYHLADGKEALTQLKNHDADIFILDWMLPGANGLEILRQLRAHSAVPILMVSAVASDLDRVLGLEIGADDYLGKPFSMVEMAARVKALLRRNYFVKQQQEQDRHSYQHMLQHRGLHWLPQQRKVLLAERDVSLTKTEFDLLGLFLKNPGRAFSRDYLLETLWPGTVAGCDRSVDNAVLKLRKKLHPWSEFIKTVWGIGYRLEKGA